MHPQITTKNRVNILLVDDEPVNLFALDSLLEQLDETLIHAKSGEEALRKVLDTDFAVILLDVRMPTMDGFETARFIRSRSRSRTTPIIFVTAFDSSDISIEEAYAIGAVDFLTKPYIPAVLKAKVSFFVEFHRSKEELRAAERRAFEATQREQKELWRTTVASIGDAVLVTDAQRRVTFLNAEAERLTGWNLAEADGQNLDVVFNIVNEDTRQTVECPVKKALATGRVVGLANHTVLIARAGTERPIDDSAAPIRDPDGDIYGVVLVFRDVADRKQIEHDLRRLAADLAEADRRKSEFLATLAHELRNPLAPLRNGLELIKRATDNPALVHQTREMMERQLAHMARLVDDLLDVSRITGGKITLKKQRLVLKRVVETAIETSLPLIEANGHKLAVHVPEDLVVDVDAIRLSQVLSNLLNNAAKFTATAGHIELSAHQDGTDVCVSIRDNGIGIAPESMPKLFVMFTQVGRSINPAQSGLGIGLALVRRLVELHGGTVSVFSDGVGQGSTFTLRLPLVSRG
jgi:PAS domain S-box-containing protein